MSYSTDEAEFWEGYHRIKAPMQGSPHSNAGDRGVDAAINKSCSILDIPFPKRTFSLPVFNRKDVVSAIG